MSSKYVAALRLSTETAQLNLRPEKLAKRTEFGRYIASDIWAAKDKRRFCLYLDIFVSGRKGFHVSFSGKRWEVFYENPFCVKCGLEATVAIAERWEQKSNNNKPHLRLYGVRDGFLVLFTVDHIFPKSLGGSDKRKNLQTMCCECNWKKANNSDIDPFQAAIEQL